MNKRIVVERLTHNYDTRCALDNINFNVASGEVFCLLGPNGSGKTTLFKILSTCISPTSGNVKILGFDLNTEKKSNSEVNRRCLSESRIRYKAHCK